MLSANPSEPEDLPVDDARNRSLIDRWIAGDGDALVDLVRLHVPWLRRHVARKLRAKARWFDTSEDVVQCVLLGSLRGGPKFRPANLAQFRAIVGRAVFNRICELHDH
jgi:DNA-directed RNA polymerase specialized sigma24 family protein